LVERIEVTSEAADATAARIALARLEPQRSAARGVH
jgi:hypothetical protein